MSNFQKKYYYDFKSVDKKNHTVEIWQDISTGISATKVLGAADPIIVSLSSIDNKFQPVRGSGADLGLFATSSMQYMDLYTANMMEYQVRHYIDAQLNWCGFLDSELFTSDFSRQKNYAVTITANDGFALLDRLYYVQSDGSKYTGISTQFDILKLILQKLGLPWTSLYVALSTTIVGVTPATSETIFHNTYVQNSNFYDEDGTALSLRELLESILKPYGAFIQQSFGNLYITDINLVAGAEYIAKVYEATNFTFSGEVGLSKNIGDLATIGFMSNNQSLTIVPGVNKEIVKYSPYRLIDINSFDDNFYTPEVAFDNEPSVYHDYGSGNYTWREYFYDDSPNLTRIPYRGYFVKMNGTGLYNQDKNDSYLKRATGINNYNYSPQTAWDKGTLAFSFASNSDILIDSSSAGKYALKVEMSVYPTILHDLANPAETPDASISQLFVHTDISIGSKHYINVINTTTGGWYASASTGFTSLMFSNKSIGSGGGVGYESMGDKWTDLKVQNLYWDGVKQTYYDTDFIVPLNTSLSGKLQFNVYAFTCYKNVGGSWQWVDVADFRIKDLNVSLVNFNGSDISNEDTEYVGYMNPQYVNEGAEIDLIQGTNINYFPFERGGFLKYNGSVYSWINKWTRASTTDNIENLLLRSFVGNYENKSIELSVTTKLITNVIGYITYNTPLSGKKFMITSATHDYANNNSELTLQEIFVDSLTINKSF